MRRRPARKKTGSWTYAHQVCSHGDVRHRSETRQSGHGYPLPCHGDDATDMDPEGPRQSGLQRCEPFSPIEAGTDCLSRGFWAFRNRLGGIRGRRIAGDARTRPPAGWEYPRFRASGGGTRHPLVSRARARQLSTLVETPALPLTTVLERENDMGGHFTVWPSSDSHRPSRLSASRDNVLRLRRRVARGAPAAGVVAVATPQSEGLVRVRGEVEIHTSPLPSRGRSRPL